MKETNPRPHRRSRQDKIQAIVKHYIPNVPVRATVPAPTQFQSEFYEELILCRGPFCSSHTPSMRPRLQVLGIAFQMKGGGDPLYKEDAEIGDALEYALNAVGLTYKGEQSK